jgi:hypothetical protein
MSRHIKLNHQAIELDLIEPRYYLVITEYCLETKTIIATYLARLPNFVALDADPLYEFYQPISN